MAGRRTSPAIFMLEPTHRVLSGGWGKLIALTPREKQRECAFIDEQSRADFIAAHLLGRVVASLLCGKPPEHLTLQQYCPDCNGPHGPPRIEEDPSLVLSMSHSSGVIAVAAAYGQIGIDVERCRTGVSQKQIYETVFSPAESAFVASINESPEMVDAKTSTARRDIAFLRYWSRKEAMIKTGQLTLDTMASFDSFPYSIEKDWNDSVLVRHHHEDWIITDFVDPACQATGAILSKVEPARVGYFDPT